MNAYIKCNYSYMCVSIDSKLVSVIAVGKNASDDIHSVYVYPSVGL